MTRLASTLAFVVGTFAAAAAAPAQSTPDYERAPINYSRTPAHDAVTRLLARIARGDVALRGSDEEILRTVLGELEIPIASQVLVFSRTSLQGGLIRPDHPRAIYFSASAYVGWVPGGLIEVAAIDPALGPVFYGFDPQDARDARRSFVRESSCLRCHGGTFVRDIPGLFARSLFTTANGEPLLRHGSTLVDDTTPFERRWGGWYVTGYEGSTPHRGNAFARERDAQLDFTPSALRPTELTGVISASNYPVATSDVVALLVLEHQLAMHNAFTQAAHRVRRILDYQHALQRSAGEPVTDTPAYDSTRTVLASATEDVLDHLLFRGAAPLPPSITGHADFRRAFATAAHRTARGESLHDLSLQNRLFANRCSFLIYSASFAALPAPLKDLILTRLAAALRSDAPTDRYAYLEPAEQQRIHAILSETHPDARRHLSPALP